MTDPTLNWIKEQVDCQEVLEAHGIEYNRKKIRSPLRDNDRTPSFEITEDRKIWTDWGLKSTKTDKKASGDVFDLEQELSDCTFSEATNNVWALAAGRPITDRLTLNNKKHTATYTKKKPRKSSGKKKKYDCLQDIERAAEYGVKQERGEEWHLKRLYDYRSPAMPDYFGILRFENGDGTDKTIRPIHKAESKLLMGEPDRKLPLFNGDQLRDTECKIAYWFEGEKAAEFGKNYITQNSTTCAYGSSQNEKTNYSVFNDWTRLALFPDGGETGEGAAEEIRDIVFRLDNPPEIRIVKLPGLGDNEDVVDYYYHKYTGKPEDFRDHINSMVEETPPEEPPSADDDDGASAESNSSDNDNSGDNNSGGDGDRSESDDSDNEEEKVPMKMPIAFNSARPRQDIVQDLKRALIPRERVFTDGEGVIELKRNNEDRIKIEPLDRDTATHIFEEHATFRKSRQGDNGQQVWYDVKITPAEAHNYLAGLRRDNEFPTITAINDHRAPVDVNGGIRLAKRGFERETGIYTDPKGPEPEPTSVKDGIAFLEDILQDFCFKHEKDGNGNDDGGDFHKRNAIMYLLTCYARSLMGGERTPLFFANANRSRIGKDYLLNLAGIITMGREPHPRAPNKKDEELRKEIFAALRGGERYIVISNAKRYIDYPSLEQAVTSQEYTARILNHSKTDTVPNTAIYAISSNNAPYTDDIAGRMVPLELAWFGEELDNRNYKYPDLHGYILGNRAKTLGALQSMVDRWVEQGCPKGSKNKNGFQKWANIIGGIMEACGLENPITTADRMVSSGSHTEQYIELLEVMANENFMGAWDNDAIRRIAQGSNLFGWWGSLTKDHRAKTKFGNMLKDYAGRTFNGKTLILDRETPPKLWRLETKKEE